MKTKIAVLMVFLLFVVCCFSNKALGTVYEVNTSTGLNEAVNNAVSGDTITVTSDIIATSFLSNVSAKSITINTAGQSYVINGNNSDGNSKVGFRFNNSESSIEGLSFSELRCVINLANGSSLTIGDGVSFSSNTADSGAAIYSNTSNLTIADKTSFSSNTANLYGGAIYNTQGSDITIGNGAVFSLNIAAESGGAIYNTQGSDITIGNEAVFFSNTAQNGGAIYNALDSSLSIGSGANFSLNMASRGGAIDNNSSMTIGNNAVFSLNTATTSYGGAIYNASNATMAIGEGIVFSSNTAFGGGAIYNYNSSTMTIGADAKFLSNIAEDIGGAIVNNDASYMEIGTGASFSANTAQNGGAIYNAPDSSLSIGSGANFSLNTASRGGAIDNNSSMTIGNNAVFSLNTATTSYGGAIYNYKFSTITIGDGARFSSNTAKYYGGAIFNNISSITIGDNAVFSFNKVPSNSGGAIYNYNSSTMTIGNGADFSSNSVAWNGGAISNSNDSAITIGSNASFSSNTAEDGGAIYNNNNSSVTVGDESLFSSNRGDFGGTIYNYKSYVTIGNDAVFSSNTAKYNGGAINNDDNSVLTLGNGVSFYANTANGGGAIHNDKKSTMTIGDGAIFSLNNTAYYGGAICSCDNSSVTIGAGALFSSNTSAAGGAIYNEQTSITIGELSSFVANTAEYGGAIYALVGSSITIDADVLFSSNEAGELGGAIFLGDGIMNMENPVFTGNEAEDFGGAVYLEGENSKAEMNIKITKDVEASGNKAGGVDNVFYLAKEADLNLDIASGKTLTLKDGVVSENDNTAITKTGEGLLLLDSQNNRIDGTLNIFGGEVKTGYSIGSGDIYFFAGLLHITDDIEMENDIYTKNLRASSQGINIEIDENADVTMKGTIGAGNDILNKTGNGSMIFDTASNVNLLKTNLTAGTLRVLTEDYVSRDVEISNAATLSGSGKITADVINNGTVRPGGETSIGTLTVDGNYTENGILGIRLYQNEIPTNDLLLVYGNAEIDEASKIDLDLRYGFKLGEEYAILTATSGVNGIYDGFANDLSSFDITISSDANNVYLTLNGAAISYDLLSGLSHNQKEVSSKIEQIAVGSEAEKVSKIIGTAVMTDEAGKKAVFDEVAGSIYANMLYAAAENPGKKRIYNQISKQENQGTQETDGEKQTLSAKNLWGQIYGSHIKRGSDSNSIKDFSDNSGYLMIGFDTYRGTNKILGYTAEFGKHSGKQGDDEFAVNDYKGGIYFGIFGEKWNFKSSLNIGYQQYEADREQKLLLSKTHSEYNGYSIGAAADVYYKLYETEKGIKLSPFGGLEGSFVHTQAFKEEAKGNAAAWLDVKANGFMVADAKLGIRVEHKSKLSWYGELSGKCNMTGAKGKFKANINGAGDEVEIYGAEKGVMSGELEAGLDLKFGNNFDVFVIGVCEQGGKVGKYSGYVGVNFGW